MQNRELDRLNEVWCGLKLPAGFKTYPFKQVLPDDSKPNVWPGFYQTWVHRVGKKVVTSEVTFPKGIATDTLDLRRILVSHLRDAIYQIVSHQVAELNPE